MKEQRVHDLRLHGLVTPKTGSEQLKGVDTCFNSREEHLNSALGIDERHSTHANSWRGGSLVPSRDGALGAVQVACQPTRHLAQSVCAHGSTIAKLSRSSPSQVSKHTLQASEKKASVDASSVVRTTAAAFAPPSAADSSSAVSTSLAFSAVRADDFVWYRRAHDVPVGGGLGLAE
eukprot:CAMPEP_0181174098 /NCGR_PEP_ID=MMETSP1096-20121128/3354_1 /TAXON_ID=156174 ORGANISM="Chrysochromulina ericina, Strain CCMP281" /NCGR_SAMPLE_ID=MMETSP1096 /ASSEMBLY_ACC=CAM_ASM_000453 /LENGTH=175 /DNA_ID=CAMNT_0023261975 /DNA_START=612 /DNA_END=1141 /DNA_ORIENTATION=-